MGTAPLGIEFLNQMTVSCLDVLWSLLEGPEGSWPMFPFSCDFSPHLSYCTSVFLELLTAPSSMFSCVYVSLGVFLREGQACVHGLCGPLDQDGGDAGGHMLRHGEKATLGILE